MIICLAGPRASGKSTTAGSLAALLGWGHFSFGDYVREIARQRGYDPRELRVLQNLGIELINQGWDVFCKNMLEFNKYSKTGSFIIDGIRHVEALNTISTITETKVILEVLEKRVKNRNRGEYKGSELHEIEKQIKNEVKDSADIIIATDNTPESIAKQIIQELARLKLLEVPVE
jgi:dephospho-CoA kinase